MFTMKIASISGVVYQVEDIARTAKFYEALGFRMGAQTEESLTVYINWFWLTFRLSKEKIATSSQTVCMKVANAQEYYEAVVERGLRPDSKPQLKPWGNKEFTIKDPDGYTLTFFEK